MPDAILRHLECFIIKSSNEFKSEITKNKELNDSEHIDFYNAIGGLCKDKTIDASNIGNSNIMHLPHKYGMFSNESIYIKSILFKFPSSVSGQFNYEIVNFDNNNKIFIVIKEGICNVGEAIILNMSITSTIGIVIYSSDESLEIPYTYTNGFFLCDNGNQIIDKACYAFSYTTTGDIIDIAAIQDDINLTKENNLINSNKLQSIESELYTKEEELCISNNALSDTSGNLYILYCPEDIFIKSAKFYFSTDSGTYKYRYLKDNTGNGFSDKSSVSFIGSVQTANIGEVLEINKTIGPNYALAIIGDDSAKLKYCNAKNDYLFKIMAVNTNIFADNTTIDQYIALSNFRFAGEFTVTITKSRYLSEEYADAKYEKIGVGFSNYLYGKKILVIGDSMVAGHSLGASKTWAAKIANRNGMTVVNKGTNGAYMTNKHYGDAQNSVYEKICVSDTSMYISDEEISSFDYILVFAGTNDCNANITIGDTNSTNVEEFCGAINAICSTLQTRTPKSKIGFITPYQRKGLESRSKLFAQAIKDVCYKYSIAVFDNTSYGAINWSNQSIVNNLTLADSYHLNEEGMEWVSYKYENFLRSL